MMTMMMQSLNESPTHDWLEQGHSYLDYWRVGDGTSLDDYHQ